MSLFEKQDKMAEEVLTKHRGKVLAIVKATRTGATTSLLKKAYELGQKTLIVAPYIEIFKMTVDDVKKLVSGAKPKIERIPANREICEKIKVKISKHPELKSLPFHYKPSCISCDLNTPDSCGLLRILDSDWDILGLTYAKLLALCLSESKTASDLLEKTKQADNLILDEFVTGIITTAPSAEIEDIPSYLDDESERFKKMLEGSIHETEFYGGIWEFANTVKIVGGKLKEGEYKIHENIIEDESRSFFEDNLTKCWQIIENLTIEGKDMRLLTKILQIIASKRFLVSKKDGKVSVRPLEDLNERSLRGPSYLKNVISNYCSKDKLVTLVDACLPDLDLTETLGVTVEPFIWGDPLNTNKSQLIICDTSKIDTISFFRNTRLQQKLKVLINFASELHKADSILVVTLDKLLAGPVLAWIEKGDIPEVMVTYYRSEFSRGITIDPKRRILILIGGPFLPKIAYLAETYKTDKLTAFRRSDMKSAFINLIGRVKDPKGIEKSIVYASGIKHDEVRAFIKQKEIEPPWIAKFPVQGADALDFEIVANLFLHARELKEKWENLEEDIPTLARILRIFDKKYKRRPTPLFEILPKDTERIKRFIDTYPDVLKKFGIKVVDVPRGARLEDAKS